MGGAFFNLVRREFYISRKGIKISIIAAFGSMIVFLLLLLSAHYGNIRRLIDYCATPTDAAMQQIENLDGIIAQLNELVLNAVTLAVKYLPMFTVCGVLFEASVGSISDTKKMWRYFLRSTPVPPWRLSLANMTVYAILTAGGAAVGAAYMALISAVTGSAFEPQDLAVLLAFIILGLFIALVFQTLIKLLKSVDKAGIAFTLMFFAVFIPLNTLNILTNPKGAQYAVDNFLNLPALFDFLTDSLPFLPLIIAALLGLIFVSNYILLERSEK